MMKQGAVACCLVLLTACAAPPATELSKTTSEAALHLASELQRAALASTEINKNRAAILIMNNENNQSAEFDLNAQIDAATKESNPAAARYATIITYVDGQQAKLERMEAATAARAEKLKAALVSAPSVNKELMEVSENLNQLGAEETGKDKLKLIAAFAIDVGKKTKAGVESAQKEAEKAQAEAQKK